MDESDESAPGAGDMLRKALRDAEAAHKVLRSTATREDHKLWAKASEGETRKDVVKLADALINASRLVVRAVELAGTFQAKLDDARAKIIQLEADLHQARQKVAGLESLIDSLYDVAAEFSEDPVRALQCVFETLGEAEHEARRQELRRG